MNSLKEKLKDALMKADFEAVARLALDSKKVLSILISFTYDKEDLLCWRAIEATGKAAGVLVEESPSAVRNIVQRLIWSVSEESGGIGWSAPEMLGEIVRNSPQVFADIPPIILSFHEEENFLKGVLWAMGRIAESGTDNVKGCSDLCLKSLDHHDPLVRGLAVYTGSRLGSQEITEKIKDMIYDEGRFTIYENHNLVEKTVGDAAKMALQRQGQIHDDKIKCKGRGKPRVREDKEEKASCPFCGELFKMPEEIKTETGSFIGGRCDCGAVYACDPTGHNVGEAYLDALTYASEGDWSRFGSLNPDENYREAVFNYDLRTHRLQKIRDIRRDYSGKIIFIKVEIKNDK